MKKIISFSLWGDNPTYTGGAVSNVKLARELYPDWICRFYLGKTVPKDVESSLLSCGPMVEVIKVDEPDDWTGMFWRFYAAADPEVDVMLSRDCDSRLSKRERDAVNEWLKTDADFHIMRDHPWHNAIILGGMFGIKNGFLRNMRELTDSYAKQNKWQTDQNFLRDVIAPKIKSAVIHDPFFQKISFPSARIGKEFVGEGYDEHDNPLHPEHRDMIPEGM